VEGQTLLDAIDHGLMDLANLAELPLLLRAFARGEVTEAWLAAEHLSCRGDFDPLCNGLFRLATCDGSRHGAGKVAGNSRLATTFCTTLIGGIPGRERSSTKGTKTTKNERLAERMPHGRGRGAISPSCFFVSFVDWISLD
jgi:hypothetical protein